MIQGVTHLGWVLVRFVAFLVRFTAQIAQSTTRFEQCRCKRRISRRKCAAWHVLGSRARAGRTRIVQIPSLGAMFARY